jgi:hypothetical protein
MITKEEQELVDAFYYSNEIGRCIFNYKVILSKRYMDYSKEELDMILALVNSIQINHLSMMQGIDSLRQLHAKGDSID